MFVMILNDGESFTKLEGCKLVQLPKAAESVDEQEFAVQTGQYKVIQEFTSDPNDIPIQNAEQFADALSEINARICTVQNNAVLADVLTAHMNKVLDMVSNQLGLLVQKLRS